MSEQQRAGRYFEFGYPHFLGGVDYCWPDERMDYNGAFSEKRDEIADLLLETTRKYIEEFQIKTNPPYYPHVSKGQKGLIVYLGMGGAWIEIWKMPGAYFTSGHNLDAWVDNAVAFNVGSDVLEAVDKTILAPRVSRKNKGYILNYPLPAGSKTIQSLKANERFIKRFYEVAELNTNITLEDKQTQRITSPKGTITIKNNVCQGKGFEGWDIAKASWIIAKIMTLSLEK